MLSLICSLALAQPQALPITDVTVFSDRARVTRSGPLSLSGEKKVELAVLVDSVDTSTLNVEVSGAELRTVELLPLEDEQLPVSEARTLLTQLEDNADAQAKLSRELSALQTQERTLQSLTPQVPAADALKPAPRLSPSGWSAVSSFMLDSLGKTQARMRELHAKLEDLNDTRQVMLSKASALGNVQRRTGTRVIANVKGSGPARATLTYVALGARWSPTYDVQLLPDTGKVQVAFAGLVSQTTGEDWSDAALTLSTAVPAARAEFPSLLTWKIGSKERFIPTPTAVSEAIRPAPPPANPEPAAHEDVELRASLQQLTLLPPSEMPRPTPSFQQPVVMPAAPSRRGLTVMKDEEQNAQAYAGMVPGGAPVAASAPASTVDFMASEVSVQSTEERTKSSGPRQQRVPFSLSPPPGYLRPSFSGDLAAASAGGYDLSWPSLQKESVQSGKDARRVALFTQSWPVTTERKIYPALFSESFLTAELKNPAPWPLPSGTAHLFVGADPAGTAQLKLTSPGETFTLPLGIDRALKPVRNVRVVDAEKGVFSKDDVSEYTVTIGLANPYRQSVAVRLYDQLPVTNDKDVEITLLQTTPVATQDKVRGHLEWRLTVPAGEKTEVAFKYTLKRPKGWRMQQWEVAP